MRRLGAASVVLGVLVLVPSLAFAQATITGVVKDASGLVLPGVTVEAASPQLIERVRTTTTASDGSFRIVDLRAGTYSVTFSLTGFSTVKRDGIELSGAFVATVNAELKVGNLEETIVVTGESPIVDIQSVNRQTTMDNDLINAIPAARSYGGLMTLMPNTVVQGGAASNAQVVPNMVVFGGAGGRSNEGRLQVDGLSVGTAFNGAGVSAYVADVNNAQEVVLTASGGMGESETGGPVLNLVPKEGGNRISGQLYFSQVTEGMVSSNYTEDLKQRGLTTPGGFTGVYDYSAGVGGPIKKDRVWWFLQVRNEGYEQRIPGMFANVNPAAWYYVPDRTRPAYGAAKFQTSALRITSQLNDKNRVTALWDEQTPCEGAGLTTDSEACRHSKEGQIICAGASPTPSCSPTSAPETGALRDVGQRIQQARWTSPQTNRLLLEAGFGTYMSRWGGEPMPGADPNLIRTTDQCTTGAGVAGQPCEHGIANLTYRAPSWSTAWVLVANYRASASYLMGRHTMKAGWQGSHLGDDRTAFLNDQFVTYRFNNGQPNQVTQNINHFKLLQRVRTSAFYAQDSWTLGRATFLGALRWDHAWSYFPEQTIPSQRFFQTARTFEYTNGASYNDLTPRGGVAFDVFGNGKTSAKFNFGRYLEAAQNGGFFITNNPTGRLSTTAARTWTDNDRDFVVDCDLNSQAAQSPTTTGSIDSCGVGNANFGTTVVSSTLDPTLQTGWGVRTGDWQWGSSIQHEVMPRVSAELSYQRRWLLNFSATDNRNVAAGDYSSFALNVPTDSRLPNGGGGQIAGLYNITPEANTRLTDNFVTLADRFGSYTQSTDSVALNVTARPRFGLTLQGGFNWARTGTDWCGARSTIPEWTVLGAQSPTNPWCDTTTSLLRTTALGSYVVPKIDVQMAFTFRSDAGATLSANYVASNGETTLGRPFAGASQTITVNLVEPGTLYGDRVNQFDIRVAKNLRFGGTRTNVGVDVTNLLNSNPVLTYNEAFSTSTTTWLRPNSVLQPRLVKFSAQVNF
jgi:hypothetical protein